MVIFPGYSKAELKFYLVGTLLMAMFWLCGCTVQASILYHGKTPVGLDNRQATSLSAEQGYVRKARD